MPRPAGSPNKPKRGMTAELKKRYGKDFNVIMKMAENALRMQEIADSMMGSDEEFSQRKECVTALEKIAQYIEPKLKAVEVTGEDGGPIGVGGKFTIEFVKSESSDS